MNIFIGVIIGLVLAYVFFRPRSAHAPSSENDESDQGGGGHEELRSRERRKNIEKLLDLFDQQEQVRNDDVQKLLGVSDATATRYLDALEQSGHIIQRGETGSGVYYTKKIQ